MAANLRTVTEAGGKTANCRLRVETAPEELADLELEPADTENKHHASLSAARSLTRLYAAMDGWKWATDYRCAETPNITMIFVHSKRATDLHGTWRSPALSEADVSLSIFDRSTAEVSRRGKDSLCRITSPLVSAWT